MSEPTTIFPGSGGLNTQQHESLIGDGEASLVENVSFDQGSLSSPGGWKKLHREIPKRTSFVSDPVTVSRTASDVDTEITPWAYIAYHEAQDPESEASFGVSFRLNHRVDDTLTGADQSATQINGPIGGEFQFQPLLMRGGDHLTRMQWILGLAITDPAGAASPAEFIRPVFYYWDQDDERLKFCAASYVIRPGVDYHISLELGALAGDSAWKIKQGDAEVTTPDQITATDLIVALPAYEDVRNTDVKAPLYIAKPPETESTGYNANDEQIRGLYDQGASSWSATSITPTTTLPTTATDAWKGYFVRRQTDGVIRQVTSSSTTLTFASGAWSSPSASDDFDLIPPMEPCPQRVTIGEVQIWDEIPRVKPWDYSDPASGVTYLPRIGMQRGDLTKGIKAFFYRGDTGAKWRPRGVHVIKDGGFWGWTRWGWDETEARSLLQEIKDQGINCIRFIASGRIGWGGFIAQTATELPDSYTAGLAELIKLCTEYGIYLVLCIEDFPRIARYLTIWDETTPEVISSNDQEAYALPTSDSRNAAIISPGWLEARKQHLTDFFEGLCRNLGDEAYLSTIAAIDLQSAGLLRSDEAPFTQFEINNRASARGCIYEGEYLLYDFPQRREFIAGSIASSLNKQRAHLNEIVPGILVGANADTQIRGGNRTSPNLNVTNDGNVRHPYALVELQGRLELDYCSWNIYLGDEVPGAGSHDLSDVAGSSTIGQFDEYARPWFLGEIGVDKTNYPSFDSGTQTLLLSSFEESEDLDSNGYVFWTAALGSTTNALANYHLWNDDALVRGYTTPRDYPWYYGNDRSSTLDYALMPGRRTSQERLSTMRSENLDETKLVGYWPLDDDGGYRVKDLSAVANHGSFRALAWDHLSPGEVHLDGERCAIQSDLSEEPSWSGAMRYNLGDRGRINLVFRVTFRIGRDMETGSSATLQDNPYETVVSLDDPTASSPAPIYELRITKNNSGDRQFYVVWNTGNTEVVTSITNAVESNPQTGALATGIVPDVGREFTILGSIQTTDGNIGHRVSVFIQNTDENGVGYSTNVSTPAGEVTLNDLKKSRLSFGASVAPNASQGAGTHAAGMFRIRDIAWGMHPIVDTTSGLGNQASMRLVPYLTSTAPDVARERIAQDAGSIALTRGSESFTTTNGALLAKDVRYYPRNWLAEVPSVEDEQRRDNKTPLVRPRLIHFRQVTVTGGELSEQWDEESQPQSSVRLAIWLGVCDFRIDEEPGATNPSPKTGEQWALTPLWHDRGTLGTIDRAWWNLAILPSRTGTPQEAFAPRWGPGLVKGFEPIRGQGQVDLDNGERHHIVATQGSLYKVERRRVADHPFYGEDSPRGGTYDWCVEFPEKPRYLTIRDERSQPDLLSRDRSRDPWPEDGCRITDSTLKWWIPNNPSAAEFWIMEAFIKIPNLYGKRTLSSRVGVTQGSSDLVESVNHHWYLDAGCPEFEIRDDEAGTSFRMFLGSNGKSKMRDVIRPNVWTHLAVQVRVKPTTAHDGAGCRMYVNGRSIEDLHVVTSGTMLAEDVPDNVTQSYLGAFGQAQPTREAVWRYGLGGRMALARIRSSNTDLESFTPEAW